MQRRTTAWLAPIVALCIAAAAAAQQQQWFELYDAAVVHVRQGEWQEAEAKLRQAQKLGPAPGRNVRRYGMMRGNYFPDFYLAVVFLNTGRPTDALRHFALARAQKISAQDREFQTIGDMEKQAAVDEKRFADAAAIAPPKPAVTAPAVPVETPSRTASTPTPPPAPIENTPRRDAAPAIDTAAVERQRRLDTAERDAMRSFFTGNYRQAVDTLDKAEREIGLRLSARGYFYRACGLAAQALRGAKVDARLMETARRQYAEAIRDGAAAQDDRRYVSPRILQALGS